MRKLAFLILAIFALTNVASAQDLKPQLCWQGDDISFIVVVHPQGSDSALVKYQTGYKTPYKYMAKTQVRKEGANWIYTFEDPNSRGSIEITLKPNGKTSAVFTDQNGQSDNFKCEEDGVVGPFPGSTISN